MLAFVIIVLCLTLGVILAAAAFFWFLSFVLWLGTPKVQH